MKYVIEVQDEFDGSLDSIVILRKRGMGGILADGIPKNKLTPLNFEYVKEHFGLTDDEVHAVRQSAMDEVWTAAKKIFALDDFEAEKCGLDDVDGMTASEAIAKLKAYEERKKSEQEIKVGDEVMAYNGDAVVFSKFLKGEEEWCTYWYPRSESFDCCNVRELRKTGRHFPEVAQMLEKMKGGGE